MLCGNGVNEKGKKCRSELGVIDVKYSQMQRRGLMVHCLLICDPNVTFIMGEASVRWVGAASDLIAGGGGSGGNVSHNSTE